MATKKVNISEVIKKSQALSAEDAKLVFDQINECFGKKESIIVDFSNLSLVVSAFMNKAFGDLYGKYSETFVKEHLRFENVAPEDSTVLGRVIERAKEYYSDKEKSVKRLDEVFGND